MRFCFRADASDVIGFGHFVRCHALATVLQLRGHEIVFFSAQLPPYLNQLLACSEMKSVRLNSAHDAQEALSNIDIYTDWLVVDHYELDIVWEKTMRTKCRRVLVLEDQPNRAHDCDLLLDQNLSVQSENQYVNLVPSQAQCLLGPQWAVLRPEFSSLRGSSLGRRSSPTLDNLLIFMGGGSVESEVLIALEGALASRWGFNRIDVVLGQPPLPHSPLGIRLGQISSTRLHVQTQNMANLMAEADLAITAGGSVSWEKCCLGLPSIVVALSDNQKPVLNALDAIGAVRAVCAEGSLTPDCYASVLNNLNTAGLSTLSRIAAGLCSGLGAKLVANELVKNL